MKNCYLLSLCFLLVPVLLTAQSPGLIVRPVGGNGNTPLNPDGNGFCSQSTAGFTTDDILQSELPFKIVPVAITEPTGDLQTGAAASFTDIVTRGDGSGFYLHKDATNIYFRLRIGNIVSGSKGYSVLIDTDGKMGNSGPDADPNYVGPAGTSPGNPGFEYEVVFQTNTQVAVYTIDGTSTPGAPLTYPLLTHSQIAVALSTDNNTPDYFFDWYVPLTAIGSPASIRLAITTVTSPNSALQGSRSDIYGINDGLSSSTSGNWQTVTAAQPPIVLSPFTTVGATCTAPPVLNSPIAAGGAIAVTGTWTRMSASKPGTATITLFKNGIAAGTTTVATGGTWNISTSVSPGDVLHAKAQAAGESQCLSSNLVTANCVSIPASPSITCASSKGITGTIPLGAIIHIYEVTTLNASPTTTQLSTGLIYTDNVTNRSFNYFGTNPQTGNACQGQNNILNTGSYMLVTDNGGCLSAPTFICITGSGPNSWAVISANALSITTPVYPFQTTVSGSGATAGQLLRLFNNNQYVASVTATGSNFSFNNLSLHASDQLKVYVQSGTSCMTVSASFLVNCYTAPPLINTNTSGNLLSGATVITGVSAYPGASLQLYKGIPPSGIATGSAVAVNANGTWSVTVPAIASGENYYAIQADGGCASPTSSPAPVLTPAVCTTITGSYSDASTVVMGTMPVPFTGTIRLYFDGVLIGTQIINATTAWSIAVPANVLYYNGALSATAQVTGGTESTGCASTIVNCTSPLVPSVNPVSTTITIGQTVNYTISNTTVAVWYGLFDNSGASYATSAYRNNTNAFVLATNPFNVTGSYMLSLSADALSGCPASVTTANVTVNAVVVPVRFLNVTARQIDHTAEISWQVSNEINVEQYIVERSTDGIHFVPAGQVGYRPSTVDINTYTFKDPLVVAGRTWYRVQQIDKDRHTQYSSIVAVSGSYDDDRLTVSPNPATGKVTIRLYTDFPEQVKMTLLDLNGKTTYTRYCFLQRGANSFVIGLSGCRSGQYIVSITGQANRFVQKLTVR